jgi:ABC-type transporter MlaC component
MRIAYPSSLKLRRSEQLWRDKTLGRERYKKLFDADFADFADYFLTLINTVYKKLTTVYTNEH